MSLQHACISRAYPASATIYTHSADLSFVFNQQGAGTAGAGPRLEHVNTQQHTQAKISEQQQKYLVRYSTVTFGIHKKESTRFPWDTRYYHLISLLADLRASTPSLTRVIQHWLLSIRSRDQVLLYIVTEGGHTHHLRQHHRRLCRPASELLPLRGMELYSFLKNHEFT